MNVFDFDGTIYDGDSTVDFFLYMIKSQPKILVCLPTQFFGFFRYSLRKISKTELKETFFSFLKEIDDVELAVANFWDINEHKIKRWYKDIQQVDDVIISASPRFLLEEICRRLGIKTLIASEVNQKTGEYSGVNCHGKEKLRRYVELFPETTYDQFYSDSKSDLALAKIAKEAFYVKKDHILSWEDLLENDGKNE